MDVNDHNRTPKSLESIRGLIQSGCNVYLILCEYKSTKKSDIQKNAQVIYEEAQKSNFDKARISKK